MSGSPATQQATGSSLQGISSIGQGLFAMHMANKNAKAAEQQAAAEEVRFRRSSARRMGKIRAAFGASGGTFEGSPIDVLADLAAEEEEDALLIRFGGAVRAREFRVGGKLKFARHATEAFGSFLKASKTLLDEERPNIAGELA